MPQFTITSRTAPFAAENLISDDPRDVINLLQRLEFSEVDVLNDGNYAFSVVCQGTGVWIITHRQRTHG